MLGPLGPDPSRGSCKKCSAWIPKEEIRDGYCQSCWRRAIGGEKTGPERPPRLTWRGVLLRMAVYYEQNNSTKGEELLEFLQRYLEQSPLKVADFIKWSKDENNDGM